jgi:hypothetical protein
MDLTLKRKLKLQVKHLIPQRPLKNDEISLKTNFIDVKLKLFKIVTLRPSQVRKKETSLFNIAPN